MNNKIIKRVIGYIVVGVAIVTIGVIAYVSTNIVDLKQVVDKEKNIVTKGEEDMQTTDVKVVPSLLDKVGKDYSWCATFQLVWNDMINEVVKQDVVFTPQIDMADNLNKRTFTDKMISDKYYYKKYGFKTLDLKKEIEDGIYKKFQQKSDILNDIDWSDNGLDKDKSRYLFYCMLYRDFKFPKKFDVLDKGEFGGKYKDVTYFGVDEETDEKVTDQLEVVFYNSKDDFAIRIFTEDGEEVIFYKNPKGNTFKEIYDNMMSEAKEYDGRTSFGELDTFKAPHINFNVKKEYKEFENKQFPTKDPAYPTAEIVKAIQSIQFTLDEKGGKVKSEAVIDMVKNAMSPMNEPREFTVDDTFTLFLKEGDKDIPYFAVTVDDISRYQQAYQ